MVIIGLGSNLGDRADQLRRAVVMLGNILSGVQCSPVYESAALLPDGAPPNWNKPFLNMAVRGETTLTPRALLDGIKAIERTLGRTARGHWAPREIDIDILAYDDCVVNESDLVIPHPALLSRDFALVPLADIAPQWAYPLAGEYHGKTARELAARLAKTIVKTDIIVT